MIPITFGIVTAEYAAFGMNTGQRILCTSENLYELYALVPPLKKLGYEVVMASSYDRAMKVIQEGRFDAIVLSAANSTADQSIPKLLKSLAPKTPILLSTLRRFEPGCYPDGVDATALTEDVPIVLNHLFSR